MIQNRGPKGVWAALGWLLGGPWLQDDPPDATRGPPRRLLERSWAVFGAKLGPSWRPKGHQNRSKTDPKIDQNFDVFWDRFLEGFCRFWEAKWSQVGTKVGSKIDVNCERGFFEKTLFFLTKN